jgi:hypothetical protein
MTLGQLLPLKVELGQGIERRDGGEEVVATCSVEKGQGEALRRARGRPRQATGRQSQHATEGYSRREAEWQTFVNQSKKGNAQQAAVR